MTDETPSCSLKSFSPIKMLTSLVLHEFRSTINDYPIPTFTCPTHKSPQAFREFWANKKVSDGLNTKEKGLKKAKKEWT